MDSRRQIRKRNRQPLIAKRQALLILALLAAFPLTARAEDKPPHYDEVMEIIKPLEYSGLHYTLPADVTLSVDSAKQTWTLRNIRKYDAEGNILLAEGRYGLCAELAFYTYHRIRPLFSDRYLIKFARVAESDFFDSPESNHVVLFIVDSTANEVYLLDPSFHVYGQNSEFKKYTLYSTKDSLEDFERKDADIAFTLDGTLPLLIKKKYLILLSVEAAPKKFDRQNLSFFVIAKRRGSSRGHYLFAVKIKNGKVTTFRNQRATQRLLTEEEENLIGNKLLSLVKTL